MAIYSVHVMIHNYFLNTFFSPITVNKIHYTAFGKFHLIEFLKILLTLLNDIRYLKKCGCFLIYNIVRHENT